MRILGIDPGLATLGFAILDDDKKGKRLVEFGVIRTLPSTQKEKRLEEIYNDLTKIIAEYKPEIASVEQLFFSKNVTTGIKVSEARGIALLALSEAGVPIHEYSPSALKKAVTGNGNADKKSMQKMVKLELGLLEIPKPDDAADATALALALSTELRYLSLS